MRKDLLAVGLIMWCLSFVVRQNAYTTILYANEIYTIIVTNLELSLLESISKTIYLNYHTVYHLNIYFKVIIFYSNIKLFKRN